MGSLFGKQKIGGGERQQCLACLEELWKIQSFQKKESDLYDTSVIKFASSNVADEQVIQEMFKVTNRLIQSINESIEHLCGISPIPEAVFPVWHAWESRYSDYLAWATVQTEVANALLSNRAEADDKLKLLNKLTAQRDKSLHKAIDESMKLLKALNLNDDEQARLFQIAKEAENETWQSDE